MSGQLTRRLKPEEEELLRKRGELASILVTLADRELELCDLRGELAAFEGRYLRAVGTLYAELDEWKARISEAQAQLTPSPTANERAEAAREQAKQTYQDAHSVASRTVDFAPSAELKKLFREVARRIHPDLSRDADDLARRTRLMAEANHAYQSGDAESLRRILQEFEDGADAIVGEGVGSELIRIIRQISQAKERVAVIEVELAALSQSEIALLKDQSEESELNGRDLLADLATSLRAQIRIAEKEYEGLLQELQT